MARIVFKIFKFIFKWLFRLFLLAVVLVVILALCQDLLLRIYMEHRLRSQTGMDAEIGRVSLGWLEPQVEIQGLKIFNSAEYGGTPFVDIPEIHVEYDWAALARSELHLTLLRFNLGELDIVKNEAGRTNIFSPHLMRSSVLAAGAGVVGAAGLKEFRGQTGLSFTGIDALNVSVGTLKYVDLKNPANDRTRKIGLENVLVRNVRGPADLVGLTVLLDLRSGDFFTSLLGLKGGGKDLGILQQLF